MSDEQLAAEQQLLEKYRKIKDEQIKCSRLGEKVYKEGPHEFTCKFECEFGPNGQKKDEYRCVDYFK